MKNTFLKIAALRMLAPALVGLFSSCIRPVEAVPPAAPPRVELEAGDSRPLLTPDVRVVIEDFKFEPSTITISPGTKITWVNKDDEPHSATSSEKPKRFDSGVLDSDKTYSFTFTEKGSFSYFCKLHPHMTGIVEVR